MLFDTVTDGAKHLHSRLSMGMSCLKNPQFTTTLLITLIPLIGVGCIASITAPSESVPGKALALEKHNENAMSKNETFL